MRTILIVEDDLLLHSAIEEALTESGYKAVVVVSGERAIEMIGASEKRYQALITDINLGFAKMDGWAVARHARRIDPAFPTIYMSGHGADDWVSKGVPNSIMLVKPFALSQLLAALLHLLNGPASTTKNGQAQK